MTHKTKDELKKYFETGDKPTQEEYAALIDALRHVDEKLPIADIESLQASLDSKANTATLLNHINDDSVHGGGSNLTGLQIKTAYEAEANTNAFTDAEKQSVADGLTHISNTDAHVTTNDRIKWDNTLKEYTEGEVLHLGFGEFFRLYNGSLYRYIGDFPEPDNTYTTNDLELESTETLPRWREVLSTYPAPEFVVISPKSVSPNTTRFIQVDASNLKQGTTLDLGENITALSYQYVSENRMLVEIQSNGIYGDYFPKINNGTEVELVEKFSISDGEVFIPDTIGSLWEDTNNQIIYTVGGWESQVSGAKYIGRFSSIPVDVDFSYVMKIHQTTNASSQMYFGFKNDPTNFTPNSSTDHFVRLFVDGDSDFNTIDNWVPNGFLEVKRTIVSGTSTATLEYLVNDVLQLSLTVNVTGVWYPHFYTYTTNKVSEIQLTIF